MALVTNKHRLELAKKYFELIETGSVYMYVGGVVPWTNETSPPSPTDADSDDISIWNNMVFCKKVSNVSFVVPRYDWTSGTKYQEYSHDTDLDGLKYYVYSNNGTQNNIWKCISNNEQTAGASGIPIATNITAGTPKSVRQYVSENLGVGNDGYVWKHMSTFSTTDFDNFATTADDSIGGWLPVSTSHINTTNRETAVPGEVYHLAIKSSYSYATAAVWAGVADKKVEIIGDGTGFEGQVKKIPSGNYYISIINKGSGYFNVDDVKVNASSTHPSLPDSIPWKNILNPIISPIQGHSYNILEELNATRLMATVDLAESETGFMAENQFRQVGLIYAPYAYSANFDDYTISGGEALGAKFTGTSGVATYKFTLGTLTGDITTISDLNSHVGGTTDFTVTQRTTGGTSIAKGKLVEVVGVSGPDIYVTFDIGYGTPSFTTTTAGHNLLIDNGTNSTTATYSAVALPTIKRYTGSILYKANIPPITRQTGSTQKIRLVLEF